jgi:hypothetical protein
MLQVTGLQEIFRFAPLDVAKAGGIADRHRVGVVKCPAVPTAFGKFRKLCELNWGPLSSESSCIFALFKTLKGKDSIKV